MKRASMLLVVLMLCGAPAAAEEVPAAVRTAAADLIPGTLPDRVNATPMPGMYQVTFGPQVVYLSEDGKYLLHGDLIDLQSSRNLTEDARKHGRRQVIDDLAEEDMVVFAPPQIQSTITVFTDTSCGYCVKLHQEIGQLLAGGVKVRYLAYPRAGVQSPSYDTLVSVWCADDQQQAMTDAKSGRAVEPKTCETSIDRHMEAAELVGVRGTPTIVLQDGQTIPGYVPAKKLIVLANAAAAN